MWIYLIEDLYSHHFINKVRKSSYMRSACFALLVCFVFACKPSGPPLKTLDLLSEGLPLKIKAPDDVEVTSTDLGIMKDVTVKNQDGYYIQIFETEAEQLAVSKVLEKIKSDIEQSKYFSRITSEDESGFIFEKKINENYTNYDFRHVKIRGDKQYVIQAGLSSEHTLDEINHIYQSVQ